MDLGDRQPGEPTIPPELQRAVDELVASLVTAPGVLDLETVTAEIDLASQLVLAPDPVVGEDGEPVEEPQD